MTKSEKILSYGIVSLLIIFNNVSFGSNYFNQTYHYLNPDSLNRTETTGVIIELPSIGFMTCGDTWNYNTGDSKALFTIVNYAGVIISQKAYGNSGENYTAKDIIRNSDSTFSVIYTVAKNFTDTTWIYLMKIDSNADTLWTKTFSSGKTKTNGRKLIATSDGGYALIGWTGNNQNQPGLFYLIKTDNDGDTLWTRQYGDTTKYHTGTSLLQLNDGGYFITGYESEGTTNSYIRDILLIRVDSLGNELWERRYGSTGLFDSPEKIISIGLNEFLIIGIKALGPAITGNPNCLFLKIDSIGNVIWQKDYGTINTEELYNVYQNNQGFVAVGFARISSSIPSYGFLIQISFNGDSLWSRYYSTDTSVGNFDDYLWNMNLVSDGGYILCGQASPGSTGTQDGWVVRVDSFGCPDSACNNLMFISPEPFTSNPNNPFFIFPNPTSNSSFIETSISLKDPACEIFIYDSRGSLINSFIYNYYGTDDSNLLLPIVKSGIYFIHIVNNHNSYILKWIRL